MPSRVTARGARGGSGPRAALLLVDAMNEFAHDDAEQLLASFRRRLPGLRKAIEEAHARGIPVIYVNDRAGRWDGDVRGLVEAARAARGGDVIAAIEPRPGDPFFLKSRYSAFDHTDVALLLEELEITRVLLAGAATERCLVQSAIDAREMHLEVTVLADACATADEELETLALRYAEEVAGAVVLHGTAFESAFV
jgi:nicotinamidase-related amidase